MPFIKKFYASKHIWASSLLGMSIDSLTTFNLLNKGNIMNKRISKHAIISTLLIAGAQLATISTAQADWYSELSILNVDIDETSLNSTGREVTANFDKDTSFSSAFGYKYGNGFRLEGEYISTDNDTDSVIFNGNNFSSANVSGSLETKSVFLNAIKNFNHGLTYSPYIGVGIGYTDVESTIGYGPTANITDSDNAFSYQFLAGLDVNLSKKITGFIEYRYSATDDISLNRFGGGPGGLQNTAQNGDIKYDAIAIGANYTF